MVMVELRREKKEPEKTVMETEFFVKVEFAMVTLGTAPICTALEHPLIVTSCTVTYGPASRR